MSFKLGDKVEKKGGAAWSGTIVGTYSTSLTPEGYAVESDSHSGSVQIYPVAALINKVSPEGANELPPLPQGYEPHELPADYQGPLWIEGQMREYGAACKAILLEAAFEAGWRTAANWMERDDLAADVGSPAYMADCDKALKGLV